MITSDDAIVRDGDADDLQLSAANHAVIVSIGEELFRTGEQQPLYRLGILRAAALVMVDAAMAGPDPWSDLPDMVDDMRDDAFAILEASIGKRPFLPAILAPQIGVTVDQGTILLVAEILRSAAQAKDLDFSAANQSIKTAISSLCAAETRAQTEVVQ